MQVVGTDPRTSAPQPSASGNVPVELNSFVGRGFELSEIKRLLQVAHAITLTGPGGIGKTRLAARAARKLSRHFPDGVIWVELAEVESPDLVAYALARSVRVQERRDEAIEDAVIAHLGERRVLLILDNCEHELDACRHLVASVVSQCERVRVLCTSRERLDIPGEAVVALSPLDVPADGGSPSVPGLAEVDALRLLVDRAVAVAPGFVLTEENARAAGEICRRLDGLPLAIELAAVRLASMSAEDLRERLDDRLRLLATGRKVGPGRSQTLRATVDWSYELLSDDERTLWRRLSVFAGSFGLAAAEDVCSGAGLARERIVDLVGTLVAKSILTMGPGRRHGRYRLLETLRLYGGQRLTEAGEDVELRRRHAAWYAGLISGGDRPWWARPEQREGFEALDVEWANVDAALDFLTASAPDSETGLRMAADLLLYWLVRGHFRAGISRLETLLAIAPASTPTRAMALWALAFLVQGSGDQAPPRALEALQEARQICNRTGGDRELAYVLHGFALVHVRMGRVDQAAEFVAMARERMLRANDAPGNVLILYMDATVASARQSPDARRLADESVQASERAGNEMIRGLANGLLGTIEWAQGDARSAEERLKEAVRIQAAIGHRWGLLTSLGGLAWVAGGRGQLDRAALLLGAGAALSRELGISLFPYAQIHQDACEAAARAGLGDPRFQERWAEGYALSREQVVAAALEEAPPARRAAAAEADGELSDRELEVARLAARGLSNPAIAAELFVSRATVKTHVSHILSKLGLQSRAQIAGWVAAHEPNHPP
jgi:predicted ATPase/DNA-binding CsgD family transcriptional regulator